METYKEGEDLCTESMFEKIISSYFGSHDGEKETLLNNIKAALTEDIIVLSEEATEWDIFQEDINKIMQGG